ncbi:kinesin-like protein KIN-10C [Rutidosis leptorrhynchoides]|uniref:kinesin-like protein KIN-10C n=1 Tax=Rutidosis leptorrhynchoides TaxID=125765 RepID=UPI003A99FA8F
METPQRKNQSSSSETGSISVPTKVRVIVRVRPFLNHEKSISSNSCVSSSSSSPLDKQEVTVQLKDPYSSRMECFKVDSFYGQEGNNNNVKEIFEKEVMPLIPSVLNGSNATVFAYGATASGKTFTMQGSNEMPGLIPMATSAIVSMCENMSKTVDISYYEIYMDKCYDLLEVNNENKIYILDDGDGNPHLIGLTKIQIHSMFDFMEIFVRATQRRNVARTCLNDVSSRSHCVLVISVSDGPECTLIGKLNLIDLAGNEDNRKTGNVGVQLQESTKINQSLFALSQVIHALENNNTRIPYRDSKLTRILQDSLGGTSLALMIACLNPGEYEQSVHTVSLAARSRRISYVVNSAQKLNTSKSHVDMEAKLRSWLESKGKTKSSKRQNVTLTKTPCSIKSTNKFNTSQVSGKPNAIRTSEQRAQIIETLTTPMSKKMKTGTRKVLSPMSSNVNIDQRTPKWKPVADDTTQIDTDTPLNKFKALSCNLKSTLAQEYVNFLNAADKGELMQLKGIGEKLADYILELRDSSPLESLNDLEKIGLSSKQVDIMFGRTAKGLFD